MSETAAMARQYANQLGELRDQARDADALLRDAGGSLDALEQAQDLVSHLREALTDLAAGASEVASEEEKAEREQAERVKKVAESRARNSTVQPGGLRRDPVRGAWDGSGYDRNEPVDVAFDDVVQVTDSAVLIDAGSDEVWLPLSQIGDHDPDDLSPGCGSGRLEIPMWLAEDRGLA